MSEATFNKFCINALNIIFSISLTTNHPRDPKLLQDNSNTNFHNDKLVAHHCPKGTGVPQKT